MNGSPGGVDFASLFPTYSNKNRDVYKTSDPPFGGSFVVYLAKGSQSDMS